MPLVINEHSAEKIPHSIVLKLQAVYDSLKTAEKKAADLLLEDPEFFSEATIIEAAEEAGCSEATLVRLSRKLGYSGYPELKTHLMMGQEEVPAQLYDGINEDDDYDSVISKVFKSCIQALSDTQKVLNNDEFKKAVDAMCSANKILFCGSGDGAGVAHSAFLRFSRVGVNAVFSFDWDTQLISASHMTSKDVIVAISFSGRTKSIVDLVKYAKRHEVTVIALTNYPVSPLTKNSDIVLLTAAFTEDIMGEIITKRITELCILECLFTNILLKNKDKLSRYLEKSNKVVVLNKL